MKTNEEAAQQILQRRDAYIKRKKKQTKIFLSLGSICVLSIAVICVALSKAPDNQTDIITDTPAVQEDIFFPEKGGTPLDNDIYITSTNLRELYDNSCAVIIGSVTEEYQFDYNDMLDFACSRVEVKSVLKGNIAAGDSITVEELGTRSDIMEISIAGTPLLREKMKVLLFLTQPSDAVQGIPAYGIVDCVTGKFFYDSDGTVHPSTEFATEHFIKLDDFNTPLPENEVLNMLKKFNE